MSRKQFKSQASSGRATGALSGFGGSGFGSHQASVLSYVQELSDYSTITDPNTVVAFKNLSKKDGTTKTRALEDLQSSLASSSDEVEEAYLDAWVKIFPRLSIDNVRRVRQLAYGLNGNICSECGKRSAKHMPRIAGPWLAGTFDTDRTVSRAAADSINLVFSTSEKIQGVRKTFQMAILQYCRDAALHETAKTLSDERTVNSDDSAAVYARVVATCLSVIGSLIKELPADDQNNELSTYEQIFDDSNLWQFACHSDASVRRSMHKLVQTCLNQHASLIRKNVQTISTAYIYKGLNSDQTGSALDFINALGALTSASPDIWTESYTGKKPAILRLSHFLKQGSQASSSTFWGRLNDLIRKLPEKLLPSTPDEVGVLLSAARHGVSRREDRLNASAAWPAYFTLVDTITTPMIEAEAEAILNADAMPVVRQYLSPSPETSDWTVTGSKTASIVSKITIIKRMTSILSHEWPLFADRLIENAKTSQPEQSKDFDKSQTEVGAAGERWADLQRELYSSSTGHGSKLHEAFATTSTHVVGECIGLLKNRNGKPYGAAAIVEHTLRRCGQYLMMDDTFRQVYATFAEDELPTLIFSPSQRALIQGLYALKSDQMFSDAFLSLLRTISDDDESMEAKVRVLRTIFTQSTPKEACKIARETLEFQNFLVESIDAWADETSAQLLAELVRLSAVSVESTDTYLTKLISLLNVTDEAGSALQAIETLSATSQSTVKEFISRPGGSGKQLLPNLLLLEQSADDTLSEKATSLSSNLSSVLSESASDTKFGLVLQNLERTSQNSLPIDSVFDLVMRLLGPDRKVSNPSDLMPPTETWCSALWAVMRPPKPSLSVMSPLGGAVHLVPQLQTRSKGFVEYDVEGFSRAFRMSIYIGKLLAETDLQNRLNQVRPIIMALLHISVLVAEDNISILGANDLWRRDGGMESEVVALDFISHSNQVLGDYWKTLTPDLDAELATEYARFCNALESLQDASNASSSMCYYASLSLAKVNDNLFDIHGYSSEQAVRSESILKASRSAKQPLIIVRCITGLRQPLSGTQTLKRFCNELIADLTELDVVERCARALEQLVYLNAILSTQEDAITAVATQRLIFLVKHLLQWLDETTPLPLRVEAIKALAQLFPGMQDMYGEHWEQTLSFLVRYWTNNSDRTDATEMFEDNIGLMHASLRLFSTLRRLSKAEEPNDDLVDALKDKHHEIQEGLLHVLKTATGINDETHQPLMLTHELVARQIAALSLKPVKDLEEFYPLFYTPSRPVQQAAFELLHKQIPLAQEQISFDAALENKTAHLPDEILSLIIEAPTLDSLAEASFERTMPLSLQGYLNSWRLLFDHFESSSYRVKSDYIEQLKDGAYLPGLLDLVLDFLGHTRGRPVDVSSLDIPNYKADLEPMPERDVQWLLTHLYYLALSYLPSLTKSYSLNIRSRQTSSAVETWTSKHISPLIITSSLQAVAEWAEKSVKEDPEYEKMSVKAGMRSKEIYVSYLVDEQTMAIKVVLPDAYPLASAQVVGVSRVAVKEEKWQNWLRNCQGVITFSNGSITDGLAAWRRNVTGALKGQTECAICYSIISVDKQLPTKRCTTCKNLFHSSCLLKWFKTSNASTCPLCRNPFNFN